MRRAMLFPKSGQGFRARIVSLAIMLLVYPGHVLGEVELPLLVQIHAHNPARAGKRVIPGGLLRLPGIS